MVSLQGKAVITPGLLYDRFRCRFLRIHGIRSHDTAPAVDLLHHLLHLRDFIALLINPGGGKADPPFGGHYVKLLEVAPFCGIFTLLFAGIVGFLPVCRYHIPDITVQFLIFV